MNPLGMYLAATDSNAEPHGLDDDYDWHLRRVASERGASAPARRSRQRAVLRRVLALGRQSFARPGLAGKPDPAARRA